MPWSNRLLQLGTITATLGGSLTAVHYTHAASSEISFWNWIGYLAVIITAIGLTLSIIGTLFPNDTKEPPLTQSQRSGHSSENYQSGRDILINTESKNEKK